MKKPISMSIRTVEHPAEDVAPEHVGPERMREGLGGCRTLVEVLVERVVRGDPGARAAPASTIAATIAVPILSVAGQRATSRTIWTGSVREVRMVAISPHVRSTRRSTSM